jgi:hypothetical protein
MNTEELLRAKLRRLSEREREALFRRIDEWIALQKTQSGNVQRALAAVKSTWASVSLDPETLHWIAEDKELEYDPSRPEGRR